MVKDDSLNSTPVRKPALSPSAPRKQACQVDLTHLRPTVLHFDSQPAILQKLR
jgi:hypothetical protein